MSQENVELVRGAFGVVNIPGDPEAMISASSPDFEMHLIAVGGGPAHYAGADGIRQFYRDVSRSWERFRFEATEVRDLGDRVLVLGDVRGRGRVSGAEVNDRWGWIVDVEQGRAITLRGFLDQREAVEAAGRAE
jgi:ketosteroid isomerase-like protein